MLFAVLLTTLLSTSPEAQFQLRHWQDGKAEMNGYSLTQPRYGAARKGQAVLIYVTEPFSKTARVKADPGRHSPANVFPVMKLNAVKDFQTGIYDYNMMSSIFVPLSGGPGHPRGTPSKITFSSQEWCGSLFEILLFDKDRVRRVRHSYFDGEADEQESFDLPMNAISVDALPILVRSIPHVMLAPGATLNARFLPALDRARLLHRPTDWQPGRLTRSPGLVARTVPAGTYQVEVWTAEVGSERYRYMVEGSHPRRLIAWEGPDGERAELLGSERMAYWALNGEGQERFLSRIGLTEK